MLSRLKLDWKTKDSGMTGNRSLPGTQDKQPCGIGVLGDAHSAIVLGPTASVTANSSAGIRPRHQGLVRLNLSDYPGEMEARPSRAMVPSRHTVSLPVSQVFRNELSSDALLRTGVKARQLSSGNDCRSFSLAASEGIL